MRARIRPRNLAAKALRSPAFRKRVVRDRTRYCRKAKHKRGG